MPTHCGTCRCAGVVSRIEVTSYAHGSTELLAVQIDAAINSGNSGGPAFNNAGECVGIAFQVCQASMVSPLNWCLRFPHSHHESLQAGSETKLLRVPSCHSHDSAGYAIAISLALTRASPKACSWSGAGQTCHHGVHLLQSYAGGEAENIGWIIPTPVIHHFLTDFITNGAFTGFPALGIKWQRMESAFLRCCSASGTCHIFNATLDLL